MEFVAKLIECPIYQITSIGYYGTLPYTPEVITFVHIV